MLFHRHVLMALIIALIAGMMACGTDPPNRDRGRTSEPDVENGVDVNNGLEPDAAFLDVNNGLNPEDAGADADPVEPDTTTVEPDAAQDVEEDTTNNVEPDVEADVEADVEPDADPDIPGSQPQAAQDVVLSEFMAQSQGGGGDTGEYIELYNPTQTTFNLNGCVLDKTTTTETMDITGDIVLAPGEYAVFASSQDGLGSIVPDGVFSFQLANGGGSFALICGAATIDELAYGSSHVSLGVSYQKDVGNLTGSNETLADHWCLTPDDGSLEYVTGKRGTPGSANVACP